MGLSITVEEYNKVFETVIRDLVCDEKLAAAMPEAMGRLETFLRYNIPQHPEIRGYIVPSIYMDICGAYATVEQRHLACVLGWCWQMIQGFVVLLDDFLDGDQSRFGNPTWFALPGNARIGINDAILLEHAVYRSISKYFATSPIRAEILEYFSTFVYEFHLAQSSESLLSGQNNWTLNSTRITIEKYRTGIMYLNKKFCCLGQIQLAYILAEKQKTKEWWAKVENICEQMAFYFTLRNDLNDSIGKNNDIKTGKWKSLAIKANEICSDEQRDTLMESYGKDDSEAVNSVKAIYNDLDLPKICEMELSLLHKHLISDISELARDEPTLGKILNNMTKWFRVSVE